MSEYVDLDTLVAEMEAKDPQGMAEAKKWAQEVLESGRLGDLIKTVFVPLSNDEVSK